MIDKIEYFNNELEKEKKYMNERLPKGLNINTHAKDLSKKDRCIVGKKN